MQQMRFNSDRKTSGKTKKAVIALIFFLLLFPAHTNDRLQAFVKSYMVRNNETVSNDVANILRGKTGIDLNKQAIVVQLNDFCETIITYQPDILQNQLPKDAEAQENDNEQDAAADSELDNEKDTEKSSISDAVSTVLSSLQNAENEDSEDFPVENSAESPVEEDPQNYIYTLPYLTDDAVLVTRIGEDIDITKQINEGNSDKIYAGYKNDSVFRSWLYESQFNNINEDSENIADALELILEGEADFTILPHHMATAIINGTMLSPRLTTSRTLFPVEYRFPVDIDDLESFTRLNDALFKLEYDGTLVNVYYKKGLKPSLVVEQESKLFKPAILNVLLLLLCSLGITYFIKNLSLYRKELHKNDTQKHKDDTEEISFTSPSERLTQLAEKNSAISELIATNENTDPYSGFYNTQYLRQKISDSFVQYAKNGSPFSVAMINATYRFDSLEQMIKIMQKEISKLPIKKTTDIAATNNADAHSSAEKNTQGPDKKIIAAHNGFGLFYILFPDMNQDDALHVIGERNCRFQNFSLLEYNGQDQYEFLGGLSLW